MAYEMWITCGKLFDKIFGSLRNTVYLYYVINDEQYEHIRIIQSLQSDLC